MAPLAPRVAGLMETRRTLDMTAGNRCIWFEQGDTVFVDRRFGARPSVVASWADLPFADGTFDFIVFDPPHCSLGSGRMAERYGRVTIAQLMQDIIAGSREAWRVARAGALMALKWSTHDIGLQRVLTHLPGWRPMFGHKIGVRTLHKSDVYWVLLARE